jgi:N-acetylmuramoyl-L-alanine amidase
MLRRFLYILLILFFSASSTWAAQAQIKNATLMGDKSLTVITLQLSQLTVLNDSYLKNPDRLVLDFKGTDNTHLLNNLKINGTVVKAIRTGVQNKKDFRAVIDVNGPVNYYITPLSAMSVGNKKIYQLKIELKLPSDPTFREPPGIVDSKAPSATSKIPDTIPPSGSTPSPTMTATQVSQPEKLRDIVIVLDPGHGGHDPGATGPRNTKEKNITLAIGLALRDDLKNVPGIKIYMTRDKDIYPTLSQRLALARRVKADIFISIHADAYRERSARGATVFALSQGRATSEAARWIAERENQSELVGGVDLGDKNAMLRSVLVDLSQTATIGSSLKLGADVLNNFRVFAKLHSYRVEQASLYVLTSPDIPAILVETGFISNPNEEQLLRSPAYQQKLALAIKDGVLRYLTDNPIEGTFFTKSLFRTEYIAKSGDSLNSIAEKFNVTVASLKKNNELSNDTVSAGQVIRIPS